MSAQHSGTGRGPAPRRRPPIWLLPLVLTTCALAVLLPRSFIADPEQGPDRRTHRPPAAGTLLGTRVAPMLPVPAGGLKPFVGRGAFARRVTVQSINGNEGFWIGSSERDRVYVEWGGDVGRNEPSRFQPRVGDRVAVIGPVQAAPPDPARRLRLNPPEARLVLRQGAFLNASNVARAP